MNRITIQDGSLVIEPLGLDAVWSFRSHITVPLAHVRGATVDPGAAAEPKGWRGPGTSTPGRTSGTFHRDGERVFWNVTDPTHVLVVQLEDESFDRAVLTVEDPAALERAVNAAVSKV